MILITRYRVDRVYPERPPKALAWFVTEADAKRYRIAKSVGGKLPRTAFKIVKTTTPDR